MVTRPISRRTGSKQEMVTHSGVSSMMRFVPVSCSKERMLRPSRPMMRPFRSSEGIWMVDTVLSAEWSAATRWMARLKISRAFLSASALARVSASRMMTADSRVTSSWMVSSGSSLASWAHARSALGGLVDLDLGLLAMTLDGVLGLFDIALAALDLSLQRRGWCSRASRDSTAISGDSSPLGDTVLGGAHLAHALLVLLLHFLLVAKASSLASTAASRRSVACFLASSAGLRPRGAAFLDEAGNESVDDETENKADDDSDDQSTIVMGSWLFPPFIWAFIPISCHKKMPWPGHRA